MALAALTWAASTAAGATVTVAPGDTLSVIAARGGTTTAALAEANGISDPDLIAAGTTLHLPGATGAGGGSLTVAPGDTLGAIAARTGTTPSALAAANGISDPDLIVAGQTLRLPGGAAAADAEGAVSAGGYRVRAGDTLSGIAAAHGTTSAALASLNRIAEPERLQAGTLLHLPAPAVSASGEGSGGDVASLLHEAALRHGVDPQLARALAWQESGWSQGARSSAGAVGVMQILPSTARWLGPALLGQPIDPYDLAQNIEGGVAYLGWLQRQAGPTHGIASYYQGLTSVRRNGLLPETQLYVANVLAQVGRV